MKRPPKWSADVAEEKHRREGELAKIAADTSEEKHAETVRRKEDRDVGNDERLPEAEYSDRKRYSK